MRDQLQGKEKKEILQGKKNDLFCIWKKLEKQEQQRVEYINMKIYKKNKKLQEIRSGCVTVKCHFSI